MGIAAFQQKALESTFMILVHFTPSEINKKQHSHIDTTVLNLSTLSSNVQSTLFEGTQSTCPFILSEGFLFFCTDLHILFWPSCGAGREIAGVQIAKALRS